MGTTTTNAMITLSTLKEDYHLSPSWLARLGPPDKTAPNPYYRCAAPMRLYLRERVEAFIAAHQEEYDRRHADFAKRSARSLAAADRQRMALVAEAEVLPISVERRTLSAVRKEAIESYNERQEERETWHYAYAGSDRAFLERITVNYIRHELTEYDGHLLEMARRVGVFEAVCIIRRRIYAAIAEAYPAYSDECERQWRERSREEQPEGDTTIVFTATPDESAPARTEQTIRKDQTE